MAKEQERLAFAWLDQHFSVRLPFTRFARNTLLLSLVGLTPVLAFYILLTSGLGRICGGQAQY